MREEISVHNIAYAGYVENGIGYVVLKDFHEQQEMICAAQLRTCEMKGELKGLVLDLRDNPGGLLESAVDVVSKFVPESSLVVTTRGRKIDSEHKYYSSETPMLMDMR